MGEGREGSRCLTEEQAQLKKAEAIAEKGQATAQRTGQWLKKRLSDRNLDRRERAELESIGRRFEGAGRRFEEVSRKVRKRRGEEGRGEERRGASEEDGAGARHLQEGGDGGGGSGRRDGDEE
eukprot:749921-Hanusia_phi.AAC.1